MLNERKRRVVTVKEKKKKREGKNNNNSVICELIVLQVPSNQSPYKFFVVRASILRFDLARDPARVINRRRSFRLCWKWLETPPRRVIIIITHTERMAGLTSAAAKRTARDTLINSRRRLRSSRLPIYRGRGSRETPRHRPFCRHGVAATRKEKKKKNSPR